MIKIMGIAAGIVLANTVGMQAASGSDGLHVHHVSEVPVAEFAPGCKSQDIPLKDSYIDACVMELNGRYPESGWVVNKAIRALVHILAGEGTITVDGVEHALRAGDVFLLLPGQRHFWTGRGLKLFIACTPPFDIALHQHVD